MAEPFSFLGGFLGNQTVQTVFTWQVAGAVINPLLAPFLTQLGQIALASHPEVVLSPAEAADMVLRGWMDQATGESEAAGSGINNERFARLVHNAGEPPGLMQVLEMYRRFDLPFEAPEGEPSLTYAVRTSRLQDQWLPWVEKLRYAVPTPGDVIDAWVENQTDQATAEKLLAQAGMDPAYAQLLHDTRGRPPGPVELGAMVHRGIIPRAGTGPDVTSFTQGVAESAVKDKWTDALFAISTYLPPPRTVTTVLKEGGYTPAEATTLLQQHGLSATDAAAYISGALAAKIVKHKELAESTVIKLYTDEAISPAAAAGYLVDLGYTDAQGAFILEVADMARYEKYLNAAIGRVRSLFDARKLDGGHATTALDRLGVPPAQRDQLLSLWEMERAAAVRLLSEAQVVDAWAYGVMSQAAATDALVALGYSEYDAWVLLSVKNKSALPNPPGQSDFPSGNIT